MFDRRRRRGDREAIPWMTSGVCFLHMHRLFSRRFTGRNKNDDVSDVLIFRDTHKLPSLLDPKFLLPHPDLTHLHLYSWATAEKFLALQPNGTTNNRRSIVLLGGSFVEHQDHVLENVNHGERERSVWKSNLEMSMYANEDPTTIPIEVCR